MHRCLFVEICFSVGVMITNFCGFFPLLYLFPFALSLSLSLSFSARAFPVSIVWEFLADWPGWNEMLTRIIKTKTSGFCLREKRRRWRGSMEQWSNGATEHGVCMGDWLKT